MPIGIEGVDVAKQDKVLIVTSVLDSVAYGSRVSVDYNPSNYVGKGFLGSRYTATETKHCKPEHRYTHTISYGVASDTDRPTE